MGVLSSVAGKIVGFAMVVFSSVSWMAFLLPAPLRSGAMEQFPGAEGTGSASDIPSGINVGMLEILRDTLPIQVWDDQIQEKKLQMWHEA